MILTTMRDRGSRQVIRSELQRDMTLRLPTGATVEVERGLVLVTREGDPEDHVLEPGMGLSLEGRGLAVAWALSPSTVCVRVGGRDSKALVVAAAHGTVAAS